jgi:hypothetical protein
MPRGQRSHKQILNYSTEVEPIKSASEIMAMLATKGATAIQIEYEKGEPTAMAFKIVHNNVEVPFRLPCNWQGVKRAMDKRKRGYSGSSEAQAKRVAWRIVKSYVEVQLAIVESNQAEMAEVFMGYAITKGGISLFQRMMQDPSRLLTEGDDPQTQTVVRGNFG